MRQKDAVCVFVESYYLLGFCVGVQESVELLAIVACLDAGQVPPVCLEIGGWLFHLVTCTD